MNNTISTLSLSAYDILAVLVPGVFLTYPFFSWFQTSEDVNTSQGLISIFLFIVVAYVIGLLWKGLMEWIFNPWLRNNHKVISKAHEKVKKNINNFILPDTLDEYYRAYYYLQKRDALNTIVTLEKQIAFVRNIALIYFLPLTPLITKWLNIESKLNLILIAFAIFMCNLFLSMLTIYIMKKKSKHILCKGSKGNKGSVKRLLFTMVSLTLLYFTFICSLCHVIEKNTLYAIVLYFFILISTSSLLFWIQRVQEKIYMLIWEGYHFYLKEEKKSTQPTASIYIIIM